MNFGVKHPAWARTSPRGAGHRAGGQHAASRSWGRVSAAVPVATSGEQRGAELPREGRTGARRRGCSASRSASPGVRSFAGTQGQQRVSPKGQCCCYVPARELGGDARCAVNPVGSPTERWWVRIAEDWDRFAAGPRQRCLISMQSVMFRRQACHFHRANATSFQFLVYFSAYVYDYLLSG